MSLEEDRAFEKQLRQIKPRELDGFMVERIGAAIKKSEKSSVRRRWNAYLAWGGLVAAASIMIVAGVSLFHGGVDIVPETVGELADSRPVESRQSISGQNAFQPILAQNNLKERVDEGIVFLGDGLTARKYRYEFIDRVVWKNPSNGALVEMEVPRDEVVLIPVQTY